MSSVLHLLSNNFKNKDKFLNLLKRTDFIVAVDGGLNIIKDYRLLNKVKYAIGDFDTCNNPEKFIDNQKIIKYPSKKDKTDTILAYEFIKAKKEYSNTNHIFFSLSGIREDHFLSFIFYFINEPLYDISKFEFHNESESIFLLKGGNYKILNQSKKLFSFFPLSRVSDLIIEPIEYQFPTTLHSFSEIGVSNIFNDDIVKLSFSGQIAILFIENKDGIKIEISKEIN